MTPATPKSKNKKHVRTLASAAAYWLSKAAYHVAPNKVTRLLRERGFAIKPFHLSEKQRALQKQAHSFFLEFDGNKIKVFEWGSGPVILLVHGWGGRALQLNSLVPEFVAQGFKVVAFDHKGHGESSSRFSSYLEIVRSTHLVVDHYAKDLYGIVAHSIGSSSTLKASENFERKLKITVVAPMGDFPNWLERLRRKVGIYEKLMASVIQQIEKDTGLSFLEQCVLDYKKISRHEVLLVHDKFDRINKISASHEIQRNLPGTDLMQTERLGHSRILSNKEVIERIVAHFPLP
jgi:esterase/lipase